jgi:maleylpyruvate isomerase
MAPMLRVHRIPYSTNVERIALAAARKGLEVTWVDHLAADRSGLIAVSGQPLAPVAELPDGRVLADSPAILRELERLWPEPPLWPADPSAAALADVLVEWFNECWKPAPNRIADGAGSPADAATLRTRTARIEGLLADGRPYLLGADYSVADVALTPFLRLCGRTLPDDEDLFHGVLAALPAPGERTRAWLERCPSAMWPAAA